MSHLGRFAGAVAIGLLLTGAAQAQATINDCESIQAADAYNQCLAKFGPTSKLNNLEPERPADVKSSSEEAAATAGKGHGARAGRRGARHGGRRHGGGGRRRAVFHVGRHRHR